VTATESQFFPRLFEPIRIGSLDVRNRIVLTGHGTGMGRDFRPNEQLIRYYEERAKGGAGLLMIGSQQVHPTSPGITNLLCNYDDSIIPGLRGICQAVHRHAAKLFGYLSHMGLATSARPRPLWSASEVHEQKYGEVAHSMTAEEIEIIVEAFAAAARRNMEAGMDGIEVHVAHGLLLHQFLSPLTNKRTDDYGGSLENRLRFPVAVLGEVRGRIGPDVPLGVRVSGAELIPGGLTLEDMCEIVPLLVAAGGLDYVDVSVGNDGNIVSNMLHEPPMGLESAPFAHLAKAIREVARVPVIHGTRMKDPAVGERLLADGAADMVGMCRALIADPHLPNKARQGQAEDIVPCVACEQACLGRLHRGLHISCVGNPVTGRELDWAAWAPAEARRKVVVIGGGPAGMEAAIVAGRRGHDVIVIERQLRLGGQIAVASKASTRHEWEDLIRHKTGQMDKAGVGVRTGVEATARMVLDENPDAVVLATGSLPTRPDIPGVDAPHVVSAADVLDGTAEVGERVLVIDHVNRQNGPTTACHLAELGKRVEVVTEGPFIGHKLETQNFSFQHQRLFRFGVVLTPHSAVVAIEPERITVRNEFTQVERIIDGIETVVLATPGRANDRLAPEFNSMIKGLYIVGDCLAPRDVEAAILEGHQAGREV